MRQRLSVLLLAICAGVGLPVYGANSSNVDLTEASCCATFSLHDSHGKRRNLSEFTGKVVAVTFGFTRCPDICPTTLIELAQVLESLEDESKNVQVLFVTLDPERDTADILSQYVPTFHPTFIALRGSPDETMQVARDFRVLYRKVPNADTENYSIDHTAGVYLFDSTGKARAYIPSVDSDSVLPEIERLLTMRSN